MFFDNFHLHEVFNVIARDAAIFGPNHGHIRVQHIKTYRYVSLAAFQRVVLKLRSAAYFARSMAGVTQLVTDETKGSEPAGVTQR